MNKVFKIGIFILLSLSSFAQKRIKDIPLPKGFVRVKVPPTSFAYFLRNLPLKDYNLVYYYNGQLKADQSANYAVIDIDIGNRDLQQCADAVMRLWAEYLYSRKYYKDIYFNFLSDGKPRYFVDYAKGDYSYKVFRKYLNYVFAYANTASLYNQLKARNISDMQIGDVFIQKGNPYGHAVIVMDMAEDTSNGRKIFLLAQSFMPAQSIHVLVNPSNKELSPWYLLEKKSVIITPNWIFSSQDLRYFK